MKPLFFLCLGTLLYIWAGYLLLLAALSLGKRRGKEKKSGSPLVTILLTVRNEERAIGERMENLLSLDYPADRCEILVASDGSTDETERIVEGMLHQGHPAFGRPMVRLIRVEAGGKSLAQNRAIPHARGEIIVLTDAGSRFDRSAVKALVRHFADRRTGCVSGKLMLRRDGSAIGESQGFYWRYEMLLRRLESRLGLLHTASGMIMAFRKDLFRPFEARYGDDCIIPLDMVARGYRVVHEDSAVVYDHFPATVNGELEARARMTLRNITGTISRIPHLNPFRRPMLFIAVFSHKTLRWLTPYFMLLLFATTCFLFPAGGFYRAFFYLQAVFYCLGAVGCAAEKNRVRLPVAAQVFNFLLANAGFFLGVLRAAGGRKVTTYKNREGRGNTGDYKNTDGLGARNVQG
ncbi:MAG: glycosyltransferase [Nitrospiraceae bacterium]|nr:glycosyltransferase [Nitrospiraceae bacterium]